MGKFIVGCLIGGAIALAGHNIIVKQCNLLRDNANNGKKQS